MTKPAGPARVWNALPAVFSFALLAVQIWIPWSVNNFQTQDGSSYVYSAVVARDLLLHPQFQEPVTLTECEDLAADLAEVSTP